MGLRPPLADRRRVGLLVRRLFAARDLPLVVDRPPLAVAALRRPVVLPAACCVALKPTGCLAIVLLSS